VVFPVSWTWFFDDVLPAWVKDRYSPRESWKGKPFTSEDGRFFLKGIRELSDLFTDERPKKLPDYLAHEKYRSSYLLYFLPLQASKFIALFGAHPKAFDAALTRARASGVFRFYDLGAGPGTASIAVLLALLGRRDELPEKIELVLFDQNLSILRDAEALLIKIGESFPRMRGRVKVRLVAGDMWQKIPKETEPVSLAIFGHTLNEFLPVRTEDGVTTPDARPFAHLFELTREGGGILFAEPAARGPSQTLSRLRDFFLEEELIESDPARIWGPCLHAGRCPFSDGRDWCHFSVPGRVPGKWFAFFSKGLSKEKDWLKYSYLWISAASDPNPDRVGPNERLVLTDPLSRDPRAEKQVLLCEPETPNRRTLGAKELWRRGMRVTLRRED
jgi:SAM-dependent methyltransferase